MARSYFDRFGHLPKPPGEDDFGFEACGLPSTPYRGDPGKTYCDGVWHVIATDDDKFANLGRCPLVRRKEIIARVGAEKQRLGGELSRLAMGHALDAGGLPTFEGYDPQRHQGAAEALATMRAFAEGRPPRRSVLLVSPAGLGKTRLLLASHFALLCGGVASQYVTTPELRRWFKRAESFDEEVVSEARAALDKYLYAEVIHFDDAGHVENDQRARGLFAEGLKDVLDRSRATAWATATNRSSAEMQQHPDLSGTILSRLVFHADIIVMAGADGRIDPPNGEG